MILHSFMNLASGRSIISSSSDFWTAAAVTATVVFLSACLEIISSRSLARFFTNSRFFYSTAAASASALTLASASALALAAASALALASASALAGFGFGVCFGFGFGGSFRFGGGFGFRFRISRGRCFLLLAQPSGLLLLPEQLLSWVQRLLPREPLLSWAPLLLAAGFLASSSMVRSGVGAISQSRYPRHPVSLLSGPHCWHYRRLTEGRYTP
ncbi:MAG: hypothetical protein R2861_14500 [Desulfobacterales bacterium]